MKVKNLFDLAAIKAVDTKARKEFGDAYAGKLIEVTDAADNGTVLGRSLVSVDPRVFTKRYAELAFLNSGIAVSNIGTDMNTIESLRIADIGGFARANSGDRNGGVISLTGENSQINVIYADAESNWNEREARQASMQGFSYVDRLVQAHSSLYQREIDKIGLLGNGTNLGVLNYTGFTSVGASAAFSTLTGLQQYNQVKDWLNTQRAAVSNTPEYTINAVAMPIATLNRLQTVVLSEANASNVTALELLQKTFPDVKFYGTSKATTSMTGYSTNEESMVFRIPNPLTLSEVTRNGFRYHVESYFGVAGCDFLEDAAGYRLTGVEA
jgi:hypothetical protein